MASLNKYQKQYLQYKTSDVQRQIVADNVKSVMTKWHINVY